MRGQLILFQTLRALLDTIPPCITMEPLYQRTARMERLSEWPAPPKKRPEANACAESSTESVRLDMGPEWKSDETKGDEIETKYLLSQLEDVADTHRVPLDLGILFRKRLHRSDVPNSFLGDFVISPSAVCVFLEISLTYWGSLWRTNGRFTNSGRPGALGGGIKPNRILGR
jgi:hypothetical protein